MNEHELAKWDSMQGLLFIGLWDRVCWEVHVKSAYILNCFVKFAPYISGIQR